MSLVAVSGAALGAGPGAVSTYRVDLPLPWGSDTEIRMPMQQMAYDFVNAAWPNLHGRITALVPELSRAAVMEIEPKAIEHENRLLTHAWMLGAAVLGGAALLFWRRK
jgi:hypothetical protein